VEGGTLETTSKSVKEFFKGTGIYRNLSMEKLDYAIRLYERLTKTTTVPTGMPGGGGSDRGDVLAGYVDALHNANIWVDLTEKHRELIKQFITDAPLSDTRKFILMERYIHHTRWSRILYLVQSYEKMEIRKLYYEHNRALKDCADWVNQTGKYREEISFI
jgi:hypothetical protein